MSVPEGLRGTGRLEVIEKALDLADYTITITANSKIFLPEYQRSLTDDINRASLVAGKSGKALVEEIADASLFVELGGDYAKEMLTGFVRLGGVTCGVVANNAEENGGVITCDGAKKAAKLVGLCDSFSIPVLTLVDSVGVEKSLEAEGTPLALQLGKLAMAYATADTAKIMEHPKVNREEFNMVTRYYRNLLRQANRKRKGKIQTKGRRLPYNCHSNSKRKFPE